MTNTLIKRLSAVAVVAGFALGASFLPAGPLRAEGGEAHLTRVDWSFSGPFGTYDRDALRRGFKVYKDVCASCHSMDLLHFRNLGEEGGPEFSVPEVKAIAAAYQVQDGPDQSGDMFERPGEGKDVFPSPYPNPEAAAASLGAAPPDLSLIAKAREGGADYIHSLLMGYKTAPADMKLPAGGHYNPVFTAGSGIIAMPPPLADGQIDYDDGTPNTVDQMSKDVSQFLMWTAEPKLEARHKMGFQVMIYLVVLAGLLFVATRKVWSDQH